MTPLERLLIDRILPHGPIGVAEFMQICLHHPEHGYYAARDPLGRGGDFVTAPEISQMFGETVGLWVVAQWIAAGKPDWRLIELGPGRGTMMADILRAAKTAGFAPDVWMVETAPKLRAAQKRRVPRARWAASLSETPPGPAVILANEFFDALPVRQYLRSPEGWRERQIGVETAGGRRRLRWGLSGAMPGGGRGETGGDWAEISPQGDAVAGEIDMRIEEHGGMALIVDYGYRAKDRPDGPTLQAVRRHRRVDPLARPGRADLSRLVDFDRLIELTPNADRHIAAQGAFLTAMEIGRRAETLAAKTPAAAADIADALERLTGEEHMGALFKVLAVAPKNSPKPHGF